MDKYEFNIKVDQIKKLVARGDFPTAMKIADTIDWRRVRTVSLLSMAAQVYEKNREYQEAKDILLMAYERAPIGKRLLYKLTDLALKEGSIEEAEAYYREFCELVQDDPRQYLLRYQILRAKKAPTDQLIRALESYASTEVDEKWLYELAELYHKAGNGDACVAVCDKIMLLFGLGKYVDKAMDLKLEYAPLSKYQMDLVENRDKYEAKLKAVEEEYSAGPVYGDDYETGEEAESPAAGSGMDVEKEAVMKIHEEAQSHRLAREMSRLAGEEEAAADMGEADPDATRLLKDIHELKDIKPTKRVLAAAAERAAAGVSGTSGGTGIAGTAENGETAGASPDSDLDADSPKNGYEQEYSQAAADEETINREAAAREAQAQAEAIRASREEAARRAEEEREIERQRNAIRAAKEREEMEEEALRRAEEEKEAARRAEEERRARKQAEIDRERAQNSRVRSIAAPEDDELEMENLDIEINNLMIEADTSEEGLAIALEALRKIHRELGYKNPVAKIESEKLNRRGISPLAAKLAGKDLVIEHAAGLTNALQNELDELMERDKSGMIVVLIDSKERLEELHARNMSLAEKFQYIAADERAEERRNTEAAVEEGLQKETAVQEKLSREILPGEDKMNAALSGERGETPKEAHAERELQTEPEYQETKAGDTDGNTDSYGVEPAEDSRGGAADRSKKETADREKNRPAEDAAAGNVSRRAEEAAASQIPESTEAAAPEDYDDGKEMDLDEFAQYACKYASEIDCSITGKSLLALYERIEMMEEDGVRLTKKAAVDLIEEAADKAENPSFGKKLTGLFSAKYDKEGLLILHENDFFD